MTEPRGEVARSGELAREEARCAAILPARAGQLFRLRHSTVSRAPEIRKVGEDCARVLRVLGLDVIDAQDVCWPPVQRHLIEPIAPSALAGIHPLVLLLVAQGDRPAPQAARLAGLGALHLHRR
eukprot:CAMPEP_0119364954 /NCGR_PEP_ID=MMETSP1334-20130426/11877_1 /TAXON_ID=127549 /ORGANISM="Calcidiscus leptoporus, Strain RCC1130" /LENGTH=123 /DNA_ID=CAMNT_0007380791 /DNA_START=256 /DNA_END=624 /DNA_ORIENTATION=-